MDISLRLNKEMLVLSGSIEAGLNRLGINTQSDLSIANVLEPETIKDALSAYVLAGAQCLIANTKGTLQAMLAKENLDSRIEDIALSALRIAKNCSPQHIIVELGNCSLPLDDMSKNSLNEFKDQYVNSCRVFNKVGECNNIEFDGFLLSGLTTISQIKCALMGIRQVSDKTIFVSSCINNEGMLNHNEDIYDYAQTLSEFGATVAGINVNCDLETIKKLAKRLRAGCALPTMVEINIDDDKDNRYFNPDSMKDICFVANESGAQFVRACGAARPAHTAVLSGISTNMPLNLKIGN